MSDEKKLNKAEELFSFGALLVLDNPAKAAAIAGGVAVATSVGVFAAVKTSLFVSGLQTAAAAVVGTAKMAAFAVASVATKVGLALAGLGKAIGLALAAGAVKAAGVVAGLGKAFGLAVATGAVKVVGVVTALAVASPLLFNVATVAAGFVVGFATVAAVIYFGMKRYQAVQQAQAQAKSGVDIIELDANLVAETNAAEFNKSVQPKTIAQMLLDSHTQAIDKRTDDENPDDQSSIQLVYDDDFATADDNHFFYQRMVESRPSLIVELRATETEMTESELDGFKAVVGTQPTLSGGSE